MCHACLIIAAAVAGAAVLWTVPVSASPVRSASFSCALANSPIELSICSDEKTSSADGAMAAAYGDALAKVSPNGRLALRDSQRAFLRYVADLCRPGGRPLDADRNPFRWTIQAQPSDSVLVSQCLAQQFEKRAAYLRVSVLPVGGHMFLVTEYHRVRAAAPVQVGALTVHDVVTETKSLIQIDAPKSEAEVNWNQASQDWLDDTMDSPNSETENHNFEAEELDVDARMELVSASPDVIVVQMGVSTYWKGRPHPQWQREARIWSLPLGRRLAPSDFLDADKPWDRALTAVAQANLKSTVDPPNNTFLGKIASIDNIDHWRLTPAGIEIVFDPYELGGYLSAAKSLLPWSEVRPYLRRDAPFDPASLREPPTPPEKP